MSAMRNRHILFTLGSAVLLALVALPAAVALAAESATDNLATRGCEECHNATTLITGRRDEWTMSLHGTGSAFLRGTSASCAGCHSGGSFQRRMLAGLSPDEVTEGDPHPTRQDCRACHQIHVTYTVVDFALEENTTNPVNLYAIPGATFDKGKGNLCANCHQPRRDFPEPVNGMITGITTHWGPHHGPQSAMMLGVAGSITGFPAAHYLNNGSLLKDGCVGCHMEPDGRHTFAPSTEVCANCHGVATFDVDGVQTLTEERCDAVGAKLLELGVINENSEEGHPTVTEAPTNVATALYNWLYVCHEDKSLGVHNPPYTEALMVESCNQIGVTSCP